MLRRIATVALIIGSAAALLIGNSTYAPFTDDASGSGGVEAGSVLVTINGSNTPDLQFGTKDECTNMAPGHACEVDLNVLNGGTLSATWAPSVTVTNDDGTEPEIECFTVTTAIPSGISEDGDDDADIDPGEGHTGTLKVTVSDDGDDSNDNACQRATATITLSVVATQSASPYN